MNQTSLREQVMQLLEKKKQEKLATREPVKMNEKIVEPVENKEEKKPVRKRRKKVVLDDDDD